MPKKGKKGKAPAIFTAEEDTAPFGLKVNEIVRTPLGVKGTVIGVKYSDSSAKTDGKLWVRYMTGQEAPLEPTLPSLQSNIASTMQALGYKIASEAVHIRRDVDAYTAALAAMEKERAEAEEAARLRALGIEPPGKGDKKKADGAKKKKKK